MKKSIAIVTFMIAMLFAMGGTIQLSSVDNQPTYNIELIETAYAQEAEAPAEEPKAEASAEAEDAASVPDEASMSPEDVDKPLATQDFISKLAKSVGGVKGLGALGIVALVLQLLALFFRTTLAKFAGRWRLLIIWTASLAGGVLALKVAQPEMEWTAALVHSNTLAWAQGWFHQVWKQFVEKKDEKGEIA